MTDSKNYRYYVLGILTLTYVFSIMDRQIMSILLQDIKEDFDLSDSQLGFLVGLAFAMFYATLGIPIARLADRWNRRNIIAIAVAIWSAATALCGLAAGFWTLFLARVGVGIGEAGGSPPSHSIISDYFEKTELSRALAVYSLGTTLGGVAGLLIGGAIADAFGWRAAFFALGIPGVLLALIVYTTIKEPVRGRLNPDFDATRPAPDVFATLRSLLRNKAYVGTNIGHTLAVTVGYGFFSWFAVILIRNFGISKTEAAQLISTALLFGGFPGILAGGFLADHLAKRSLDWMAWVPAIALAIALPAYLGALLGGTQFLMIVFFTLGAFFFSVHHAPALAIVQAVVNPDQRALAAAFVFFFSNMFGLGLGPVIVGALSDAFALQSPDLSLNYALAVIVLLMIPASLTYVWTARVLNRDASKVAEKPSHA